MAIVIAEWAYRLNKLEWLVIMAGVAALFNPIVPVFLSKSEWRVFDVVAAALMFLSVYRLEQEK